MRPLRETAQSPFNINSTTPPIVYRSNHEKIYNWVIKIKKHRSDIQFPIKLHFIFSNIKTPCLIYDFVGTWD